MKRKFSLLLAALLLLWAAHSPSAQAYGGLPSVVRDDDEIKVDEEDVPLLEFPAAVVEAEVTVDENGTASAALSAEHILEAVGSVASGDAVRITAAAVSGAENVRTVCAAVPREALQAVAEQTGAEVEIVTDIGQLTLPNAAVAAIVEKAGGEDVTFRMSQEAPELGTELLEDVEEGRILDGSVTEIDILSGGRSITSWDGTAVSLELPAGAGLFEQGKGYEVIQLSADQSRTGHTGCCVMSGYGLRVEIAITHLSTFVVLADAVEESMNVWPASMAASPLAAPASGGSSSTGGGTAVMWAAAGLVLAGGAAAVGIFLHRREN